MPRLISGPIGLRSNSSAVTIPKFGPAPRMPQNRSACSSALARSWRPSAVTTSTARRQSIASPSFRWRRPMPPPRVRPATPVCETVPAVQASPTAWAASSSSASSTPPLQLSDAPDGVYGDAAHPGEVDDHPVVAGGVPGEAVPAAADGDLQALVAGERQATATSSALVGRRMPAGRRSIMPFHTARDASYDSSPGRTTSPVNAPRSARSRARSMFRTAGGPWDASRTFVGCRGMSVPWRSTNRRAAGFRPSCARPWP